MVNETAKVNVTLNSQEAQHQLEELQNEMKRLIQLKKKAEEAGDVDGYKKIDKEIKKVNRSANKLVIEHRELEQTLKNLNGASIKELKDAERTLTAQTIDLNRETAEYARKNVQLKRVKTELRNINSEYRQQNGLLKSLKTFLPAFSFAAAIAGATAFVRKMNQAIEASDNFEERLDNLSALTGLEGIELEKLGETAKQTSVKITEGGVRIKQSADDIVDAYTRVGSQRPELLKNGEALASVTEDAIILSEAAKSQLEPAVKGLTTTMNQFNIGADGSRRIINAMAAGSKEGAADIPYLTQAIEKSGTTMNLMNVSLEQNIGLIEAIAPNYAKAEMAGNSLDKVFLKLKEKQIGYKDGVFSVNLALEELEQRYKNGESAASIFGVEHAKMGELLVQNKEEFIRYTTAVTGTNIAIEQAAKNTNNAKAIQAQARNEFHLAAIELGQNLSPAMTFLYKTAGSVARSFSDMIAKSPVKSLREQQTELNLLVTSITNANNTQETRNSLIAELQKKYPSFLENLDTEKLTNEQLRDRLKEVNEEYENKILLAVKEEKLQGNYKERTDLKLKELNLIKNITAKEKEIADLKKEQSELAPASVEWKNYSQQLFIAESDLTGFTNKLEKNRQKFAELRREEVELNNAIKAMAGTASERTRSVDTISADNTTSNATKRIENLKKQIENEFSEKEKILKEQRAKEEISQEQFQGRMKLLELAHLEAQKAFKLENGEDILDIESEIADKKIEIVNDRIKQEEQIEKEAEQKKKERIEKLKKDFEEIKDLYGDKYSDPKDNTQNGQIKSIRKIGENYEEQLNSQLATLKQEENALVNSEYFKTLTVEQQESERTAIMKREADIREKFHEQFMEDALEQAEIWIDISGQVGTMLGEMLADEEATLKDFGKNVLLLALDVVEKQLEIAIVSATIQSLATPGSVLTFGAKGLIQAAILTGIMKTAFAGLKGLIGNWSEGGYTGNGDTLEPAGIVHRGEYVVPKRLMNNLAVANMVSTIEAIRGRKMNMSSTLPGFVEGGYIDTSPLGGLLVNLFGGALMDKTQNNIIKQLANTVNGMTRRSLNMNTATVLSAIEASKTASQTQLSTNINTGNSPLQTSTQPDNDISSLIAKQQENHKELVSAIAQLKIYTAIEDVNRGQENYAKIQASRGL